MTLFAIYQSIRHYFLLSCILHYIVNKVKKNGAGGTTERREGVSK
jgi:hypothetical protein